jgi:hypothetical protein
VRVRKHAAGSIAHSDGERVCNLAPPGANPLVLKSAATARSRPLKRPHPRRRPQPA